MIAYPGLETILFMYLIYILFHLDIVKMLVEAGANMKINDALGKPLLSLACDNKFTNAEIIDYLLEKGCDPFTLDTNQGNGTCVQKLLLAQPGTLIYKSDVVRATEKLISKMTEISPQETMKFLNLSTLKLEPPIGMMASKWKDTKEEIEILKMLINAGADPQLRFGFGSKSSFMYRHKKENKIGSYYWAP